MSGSSGDPRGISDEAVARERTAAVRCLLAHPLWTRRRGAEELRVIVRRRDWLADWFSRHFGWSLIVDPAAGFARLHKVPASTAFGVDGGTSTEEPASANDPSPEDPLPDRGLAPEARPYDTGLKDAGGNEQQIPDSAFGNDEQQRPAATAHAEQEREQATEDLRSGGASLTMHPPGELAADARRPPRFRHARPAALPGKPAFDRRRYALFCLCLAALEDCAGQVTLRRLAEILESQASAADSVEPFEPGRLPERRAFVDSIRLLLELGVLSVRDGETERFLTSEEGDALYDVNEPLLGQLLAAPVPPSLAGSFDGMLEETYAETDEGERQRARHQVMRRLIDDPIVYWDDLTPRQRDWLERSLGHVGRVLEETGMVLERRREGLSAIDPRAELTDVKFPDGGSTVKHAALLLAEQLTRRAKDNGTRRVSGDELNEIITGLSADYGERCGWRTEYQEEEGAHRLAEDAMELLASLDLVRRDGEEWRALPAIARFAPASPEEADDAASRPRRRR